MTEEVMEKVIRDGKVAILYSPGFGAGWSTWNSQPELVFDPEVVQLVLDGKKDQIEGRMRERYGEHGVYCGGAEDLEVAWLPVGTPFYIDDYDGSESIVTSDRFEITA